MFVAKCGQISARRACLTPYKIEEEKTTLVDPWLTIARIYIANGIEQDARSPKDNIAGKTETHTSSSSAISQTWYGAGISRLKKRTRLVLQKFCTLETIQNPDLLSFIAGCQVCSFVNSR